MRVSTKPEACVVPAAEKDVPILLRLIKELAEFEGLSDQVTATEKVLRESLFGPRPAAEALLLLHHGQVAGYAIFFHNFSTFHGRPGVYIEDVYVSPPFRRRGLARAALIYLARLAQERGCPRLEFAVLEWNQDAIKLYQGLGAAELEDWRPWRIAGPALDALAASSP